MKTHTYSWIPILNIVNAVRIFWNWLSKIIVSQKEYSLTMCNYIYFITMYVDNIVNLRSNSIK